MSFFFFLHPSKFCTFIHLDVSLVFWFETKLKSSPFGNDKK
uniref:Uncharacterized protein n=1 Tax=Rhizophora mucronata TaxID=61149 RepID=A0A2P2PHZ2_RHIMU